MTCEYNNLSPSSARYSPPCARHTPGFLPPLSGASDAASQEPWPSGWSENTAPGHIARYNVITDKYIYYTLISIYFICSMWLIITDRNVKNTTCRCESLLQMNTDNVSEIQIFQMLWVEMRIKRKGLGWTISQKYHIAIPKILNHGYLFITQEN